jgi:hypothetical protein
MDEDRTEIEVHAQASKEGLSLKAKGAGLFVLLALDIAGMAWIGHALVEKDAATVSYVPLFLLFFVAIILAKILAAVLGLRFTDN